MEWTNSLKGHSLPNSQIFTKENILTFWISVSLDIKSAINGFPKKKAPGLDEFTGKFYPIFKKENIPSTHEKNS